MDAVDRIKRIFNGKQEIWSITKVIYDFSYHLDHPLLHSMHKQQHLLTYTCYKMQFPLAEKMMMSYQQAILSSDDLTLMC